ncbi:hypothetical protein [Roseiarcus sp.]|uniref:hypothetical protein n=1 Tax=Roseiarcus sp. TaxID=1969460 RepID=UPI003C726860
MAPTTRFCRGAEDLRAFRIWLRHNYQTPEWLIEAWHQGRVVAPRLASGWKRLRLARADRQSRLRSAVAYEDFGIHRRQAAETRRNRGLPEGGPFRL